MLDKPDAFKDEVAEGAERTSCDPRTVVEMVIPAKKIIKIRFSDELFDWFTSERVKTRGMGNECTYASEVFLFHSLFFR